ncbi:MAG: anti-sigma factor [Candidatus Baltobacteraceae bacterium]
MMHIDESAELYALGMLDEREAAQVRRHIATCDSCRDLVVHAEDVVSRIGEEAPQLEPSTSLRARILQSARGTAPSKPSPHWRWFTSGILTGAAAGIVAAALVLLPGRTNIQNSATQNDLAFSTIVQSHFSHVPFQALQQNAPQGKVLYAKHGEWLYVVVHSPQPGTRVGFEGASGGSNLRDLVVFGANGTLFIRAPGAFKAIILVLRGETLARAVPAIARP